MKLDDKFKSIAFDILDSNLKDIFKERYEKDTMFIVHSGGGCFHIGLDDPILNDEWILNPIGEHGTGGDPDLDFSTQLDKEGIWLTSIDCAEGYLDYIDSFENIVKRIEDGSLAKVLKSKSVKEKS
jgi:hypothetical protein|tara:strand:- start:1041 stop:1418 length:378 start_codon:yes stop_codon:yes gene_type:complete